MGTGRPGQRVVRLQLPSDDVPRRVARRDRNLLLRDQQLPHCDQFQTDDRAERLGTRLSGQ